MAVDAEAYLQLVRPKSRVAMSMLPRSFPVKSPGVRPLSYHFNPWSSAEVQFQEVVLGHGMLDPKRHEA